MSEYFSSSLSSLSPYTPGEQPEDLSRYIKLNTNENPYSMDESSIAEAVKSMRSLNLYPDPLQKNLRKKLSELYGVKNENVTLSNGSDEMLLFSFLAFCPRGSRILTPDITYSFYNTLTSLVGLETVEIPLMNDFTIDADAFCREEGTVVIANPNALTGIALGIDDVERIVKSRRDRVVIIDEAYADFGDVTALPLIEKYPNLVVVRTFSKSRSLAGARLGYAFADEVLIEDIERVRGSINPYNINSFTLCATEWKLRDEKSTWENIERIKETRKWTTEKLGKLGFRVLPSKANFVFVTNPLFPGDTYYSLLKERGILIRHFDKPRISSWSRITIGKREDMEKLISITEALVNERI